MKKRKKQCQYCGDTFYPKRIDAMYCSTSCRGMGYRAKKKPTMYRGPISIKFDVEPREYLYLHNEGKKHWSTPEQFAQSLLKIIIDKELN